MLSADLAPLRLTMHPQQLLQQDHDSMITHKVDTNGTSIYLNISLDYIVFNYLSIIYSPVLHMKIPHGSSWLMTLCFFAWQG